MIGNQQDGPASWRCFIAVEISDEVREAAARLQSKLRRTGADVSYPPPANMHLTIAFLGDTLTSKIEPLKSELDRVTAGVALFELAFAGTGFFGPPRQPRVIWAGLESMPPLLVKLHTELDAALRGLEFIVEAREFRPHLTLGRIRSRKGQAELTAAAASLTSSRLGCTAVNRVLLFRSHLDEPQARYSILHESYLKGN